MVADANAARLVKTRHFFKSPHAGLYRFRVRRLSLDYGNLFEHLKILIADNKMLRAQLASSRRYSR